MVVAIIVPVIAVVAAIAVGEGRLKRVVARIGWAEPFNLNEVGACLQGAGDSEILVDAAIVILDDQTAVFPVQGPVGVRAAGSAQLQGGGLLQDDAEVIRVPRGFQTSSRGRGNSHFGRRSAGVAVVVAIVAVGEGRLKRIVARIRRAEPFNLNEVGACLQGAGDSEILVDAAIVILDDQTAVFPVQGPVGVRAAGGAQLQGGGLL